MGNGPEPCWPMSGPPLTPLTLLSSFAPQDPPHKSHNASGKYPTMHHFVTEMYTFLLQSGALWDICLMLCGICEMGLPGSLSASVWVLSQCHRSDHFQHNNSDTILSLQWKALCWYDCICVWKHKQSCHHDNSTVSVPTLEMKLHFKIT